MLPEYCCIRHATPYGVVGDAVSPTATDREPLMGFGFKQRVFLQHFLARTPTGGDAGANEEPAENRLKLWRRTGIIGSG